ncbi:hypothetical protein BKA70DRAFT_1443280 [Coprinopsis sp. MPI-PUGE-AT-0042]|nr:hypothetical protein BKA70DRAFT_1443280 [Coprinopsis sp. MPI-PUGE-AT-0042]
MLVMSKWVSLIGTQQYSGRATRETGLLSLQASTGESTAVLLVSAGVTDISGEQQPLVFARSLKQLAHASTIPVLLQTHSLSVIDIRGARGQLELLDEPDIGSMKSSIWIVYAFRASVLSLCYLAKKLKLLRTQPQGPQPQLQRVCMWAGNRDGATTSTTEETNGKDETESDDGDKRRAQLKPTTQISTSATSLPPSSVGDGVVITFDWYVVKGSLKFYVKDNARWVRWGITVLGKEHTGDAKLVPLPPV